jgi:hypothetical protein
MTNTATVLSVLALFVSIASAVLAWWIARQQNSLQGRLLELENARERDRLKAARSARLSATVETDGRETSLLLRNHGSAAARDVRLQLDGRSALQHPLIPGGIEEVTIVGPGASTRYPLAPTFGMGRVVDVQVEWNDDSGEPGTWQSHLTLF